jgi:hypothetical protein
MKVGDYLEQVESGQSVRYREIADNDPEGAIELLENSSIERTRNTINVDSEYNGDLQEEFDPIESIETFISTFLDPKGQYEAGFNSAKKECDNINNNYNNDRANDLITRNANKYDRFAKICDSGLALGGSIFSLSASLGSINGIGISTVTGILSASGSARYQGARDLSQKEAAEGLKDAYGHMRVEKI